MEQSIGRHRVEVVAVDDGSTDGSGEQLEILAKFWDNLIVVHQENSDGPSRPRNVGLEKATGRFVFFLDADDYLGPEALQRMGPWRTGNRWTSFLAAESRGRLEGASRQCRPPAAHRYLRRRL